MIDQSGKTKYHCMTEKTMNSILVKSVLLSLLLCSILSFLFSPRLIHYAFGMALGILIFKIGILFFGEIETYGELINIKRVIISDSNLKFTFFGSIVANIIAGLPLSYLCGYKGIFYSFGLLIGSLLSLLTFILYCKTEYLNKSEETTNDQAHTK